MEDRLLLFRIDNRLVHGQVCTVWIPQKKIKRVVIIHDEYAADEFFRDLNASAVPATCKCDTISTEEAAKQWKEDKFGDQNTIVIFQTPEHAKKAIDAGIEINEMQVATLAGGAGSVTIYKQVNVDPARAKLFLDLYESGTKCYCQMYADNPREDMKELLLANAKALQL